MEKKLEVKNLRISFRTPGGKVQAVRNISFDLYKGETLAIVGESGSGKSVTNRAIIGISSGNAITESGEIIYDGQDLLKISEEEFHKIRGDKIAMIFQDPMSSLNPIMKVGKQLTEAMILKGKASQRNARTVFNGMLKALNKNMNEIADPAKAKENDASCKLFDDFCIESTRLESKFNEFTRVAQEIKDEVGRALFLASKKQPVEEAKLYKETIASFATIIDPEYVVPNEKTIALQADLKRLSAAAARSTSELSSESTAVLEKVLAVVTEVLDREKINYFTLGYYALKKGTEGIYEQPISELNAMTRKYLDEEFMLEFIKNGSVALQHSHNDSLNQKKALIPLLDKTIEFFKNGEITKASAKEHTKELYKLVFNAIDDLEFIKNSTEYIFKSSLEDAIGKYLFGVKNNPKEISRFEKQTEKRNKLVEAGKDPSWKVVPASLVDLDLARNNICQIIENLKANYLAQFENDENYNSHEKMVALIDFFKAKASEVVYKVTRKVAKIKALKLLDEVGIPNPAARYKQYPFQFSGGMRQRVVIAIALAANPDILICDEPTTALDVTIQSQILELINRLKEERNLSVIFITHDLGVVANMADRIAVMYAGKIVEYGTADDVFYDPRHPYTWALLSSMPDLDTTEKLEAIPGTPPNMIFPPKGDAFAARNKYALAIDLEEEPPLFQVSDSHYAATWLLHPKAPKVEAPRIVTDRIERMKKKMESEMNE